MTRHYWLDHALMPEGWRDAVLVSVKNGLISAIDLTPSPDRRETAERVSGAVLPGMPNLHSHTFQRGMAGLAETRGPTGDSFWTWRQVMYRFLEHLDPDDVEAIAAMAMMEMLEGGFTSLAEFHYLHHDPKGQAYANPAELAIRIIAAAEQTGIGLTLLPVFYAQGGFGGQPVADQQRRFFNDPDSYLTLHQEAARALQSLPLAKIGIAPHSLRAVTPDQLEKLLGAGICGPIHIHIAEQRKEVEDCLSWSGQRPVEWLFNHHDVNARWCLIHATHITDQETERVAASQAVAGLCPLTEANLGDGFFNAHIFQKAQGAYGVGSDSNIEITAFGELRCFEYGQRLLHRGRNMLAIDEGHSTARDLYMSAVKGGTRALGLGEAAGLTVGARADWVVLDLSHPTLEPLPQTHWLDAATFVTDRTAIDGVMSGGLWRVKHGRHHAREAITARYVTRMKALMDRFG